MFEEILNLLEEKKKYFYNFYLAAQQRGRKGQKKQYKVEKWVQAELINRFWDNETTVIPEYRLNDRYFWDLYFPEEDIFVAIKSYIESAQGLAAESPGMQRDLQEIKKNSRKCVFLLLLPSGEGKRNKRKNRYIDEVNRIIGETLQERSRIKKGKGEDIYFENTADNKGIHIHYWEFRENA